MFSVTQIYIKDLVMLGTLSQFSCLFHNHGNRGLESLDNFPKGIDLLLDANGI